jgi:hypothetical protein
VDTNSETCRSEGKALWHITLNLVYEGEANDTCQDGVERIRKALNPLIENGSGIKQMLIFGLPAKE